MMDESARERIPSRIVVDEDTIREKLNQIFRTRTGHASDVSRKLREFYEACDNCEKTENIASKFDSLTEAFSKLEKVHHEFVKLAGDKDSERVKGSTAQLDEFISKLQSASKQIEQCKSTSAKTQCDNMPLGDSASCISNRSSISSAQARAIAKKAMLESKAKFLDRQMEMEYKQFEIEQGLKRLKLEAEIEAASVEENVLSNLANENKYTPKQIDDSRPEPAIELCLDALNRSKTNCIDTSIKLPQVSHENKIKVELNPHAKEWTSTGSVDKTSGNVDSSENKDTQPARNNCVDETFIQRFILDSVNLPKMRLMTFDGNPMDYWVFQNSFDSCVGQSSISDGVKLNQLYEYCIGKAAQVIKPCMIMNPSEGYARARQLLKDRFGNNYTISEAWVKKITEGPAIRSNCGQALQELADDVNCCVETLKAMNMLEEIDSRCRMVKIAERLPFYIQMRWRKHAFYCLNKTSKYPNILEFATFLETVAREMLDPVFGSLGSGDKFRNNSKPPNRPSRRGGSIFTVVSRNDKVYQQGETTHSETKPKPKVVKCFICKGFHQMHNCRQFLEMTPDKRLEVVREHRLCYNCLEFRNHTAKLCRHVRNCDVPNCDQKHSRLLHSALYNTNFPLTRQSFTPLNQEIGLHAQQQQNRTQVRAEANSCACGKGDSDALKVSLPIVTIHVRGQGQSEFVRINALLDPGSNKTFCSKELVNLLGMKGKSSTLMLKTLNKGSESCVEEISLEAMSTIGKRKSRQIVPLNKVYALNEFPTLTGSIVSSSDLDSWDHLKDIEGPKISEGVMLLIGQDVPLGLRPIEIRRGKDNEPYAVQTVLGWTINGPLDELCEELVAASHFIDVKESSDISIERQLEQFWKIDTGEILSNSVPEMSVDDKRVLKVWNDSVTYKDGHYELDIPFRIDPPDLPNNKTLALKRLQYLGKRFERNPEFHARYAKEINTLLKNGYAEVVVQDESDIDLEGKVWYLPHHAVTNPNKPEKLRVVFDCAAEYRETSLNKNVLQGPDLANKLLGVLLRFRKNKIALMSDIEAMFYQVKVTPEHRNVLRFLWWENGDFTKEPNIYRMTVHPFGGVWSPSCATFALRRTAQDNVNEFDSEAVSTVIKNFYVDDCLKSLNFEERAICLVKELSMLTSMGGFHLTKWISNSPTVIETIPVEERAESVQEIQINSGSLPVKRALGVLWNTNDDCFAINTCISDKEPSYTRRGLLSITSSVYDPLGVVSPFVLQAKKLFQAECKLNKSWDDELSDENKRPWSKWLTDLPVLQGLKIERCISPDDFESCVKVELHHFCDASMEAYGAVSYIRFVNIEGKVHCSFLMGKSRLAPMKQMTIPRLELSAAVMAVRMSSLINEELSMEIDANVYWTDSMIVLQYIKNTSKRFHTFVANRVAIIHDGSSADSWRYVDTKSNPADDASRGLNAQQMISSQRWLQGPAFLWKDASEWPQPPDNSISLLDSDKEVKQNADSCAVEVQLQSPTDRLICFYSNWHRLKKAVSWMLRFKSYLKCKTVKGGNLTSAELNSAENAIVVYIQNQCFKNELNLLRSKTTVNKRSSIYDLEPVLNAEGLICVGGRLVSAPISESAKNPVILPREHHVSTLLVRYIHEQETKHSGREYVLSVIRLNYWIPKSRTLINRVLRQCLMCKRLRATPGSQQMAALPVDRVSPSIVPFACVGVDCFGPFLVKRGRSQEKRYGCIFTCLAIRAIHIERLHSLEADSFISALIRFIARRGKPELIRSDNGTNFQAGESEFNDSIAQWNRNSKTNEFLLQRQIKWEFNPPTASHMGGVWERQIRTVRRALSVVLKGQVLDDERLDTVFCEVESVVNARPITYVSDSPKDPEPLTPNHMLLLRSNQNMPPGVFKPHDCFIRRWRHAQFLADQFWKRWLAEYLPTLQFRNRWKEKRENFKRDDIVLVMDESTSRMNWPLGRVLEVFEGKDKLVRSVKVKTKSSVLVRPITKLCYLENTSVSSE